MLSLWPEDASAERARKRVMESLERVGNGAIPRAPLSFSKLRKVSSKRVASGESARRASILLLARRTDAGIWIPVMAKRHGTAAADCMAKARALLRYATIAAFRKSHSPGGERVHVCSDGKVVAERRERRLES